MKKVKLGLIVFSTVLVGACCQKTNAPDVVKTAFAEKFSNAQNVKWDKENETEWEAEFKMENVEYSANFSKTGEWMETEYEVEKSALPPAILSLLENEYKEYEIKNIEYSEKPEGAFYELELEKGEETIDLVFDNTGNFIKREMKENDETDE